MTVVFLHGKDPYLSHFQPQATCVHLIKCLESGFMHHFPLEKEQELDSETV